uniref:Nuclear receptor domain-containing protein n=1 Tax=Caenorhabditis japonica TaxID=281687 RepID=A0A8R1EMW2_CAEJA
VASCNGCKSFFRRVTIEKLQYTCQHDNKCYENRKVGGGGSSPKCRSCRYKKCLDMGMNPLGIQSELRKHSECSDDVENTSGKEIVVLPRIHEPPKSIESQITDLIQQLIILDLKTVAFRDCSYNPTTLPPLKRRCQR